ncbi:MULTISPECIES: flagellar basal body rod protein FlgB [Mesobacillus]|uniref:Flagellar basal body rod protein FlgB n=2 Tax=Mesobacillus TaxID=2675231 RepID=A0A0D6Z7J0_9BACI|nr:MULTISPECIES: flagellar basal body rod protein FlgB [Mesobacillus]KIY21542.1 flagellar basal body rod protein FlgB [Mesobacillus subterraneus]MDQ0412512.1 flagellar basal-body rod protein FlgB [Mesobacillus stamsii]
MNLFSNTISTLEHALDYSSAKQKVISQNIANVDTPNYKAKDVSFKAVFQDVMEQSFEANKSDSRHYDFFSRPSRLPGIINKQNVNYNENGNSVDLDKEMADMATNQIYYNAVTERINGKFNTLQSVIRGGR